MRRRQWKLYIEDILEAIVRIERYTQGMDLEGFRASDITVDAVIRNFTIIGEAARQIPPEIEKANSDIPWDKMRALRNIVVHQYFGVDASILWETLRHDLPPLTPRLRRVLEKSKLGDISRHLRLSPATSAEWRCQPPSCGHPCLLL